MNPLFPMVLPSPNFPDAPECPPSLPLLPPLTASSSSHLRCFSLTPLHLLSHLVRICRSAPGYQLLLAQRIPWLHLQPLNPSLHLGLSKHPLHLGSFFTLLHQKPSPLQLHRAYLSLRLHLGQASSCLHLRLRLALAYPRLRHRHLSHRLCLSPLVPWLLVGRSSPPRSPVPFV